jgi:hypothetical protein
MPIPTSRITADAIMGKLDGVGAGEDNRIRLRLWRRAGRAWGNQEEVCTPRSCPGGITLMPGTKATEGSEPVSAPTGPIRPAGATYTVGASVHVRDGCASGPIDCDATIVAVRTYHDGTVTGYRVRFEGSNHPIWTAPAGIAGGPTGVCSLPDGFPSRVRSDPVSPRVRAKRPRIVKVAPRRRCPQCGHKV